MGGGKEPKTEVVETPMSKEQLAIVKNRESFYQSFTLPALKNYYQDTRQFNLNDELLQTDPTVAKQNVGLAFNSQGSQLAKMLQQRGGDVEGGVKQLDTQKGIAEGRAYNKSLLESIMQHNNIVNQQNQNTLQEAQVKQGGINMLLSQAPQPTREGQAIITQTPGKKGMMAQIGQSIMGAAGSMGSMGGGMPGMGGGGTSFSGGEILNSGTASSVAKNKNFYQNATW
jgi:hypothetical protein